MEHLVLDFGLALALIGIAVSLAAKLRLSNVPFLILIGMVRFAPDQCLGPRAWLSMFVQLPAAGRRRRTARFRTVTNRGRKIDVRVQQSP